MAACTNIFTVILFSEIVLISFNSIYLKNSGKANAQEQPIGGRRQTKMQNYTVELLMVCDHAVYSWFFNLTNAKNETEVTSSIRKYYSHIFNAMDSRYRSISGDEIDFRINLSLIDLVIAENLSISSWTEDYKIPPYKESNRWMTPASEVLDAFVVWVNTSNLPKHDHAILFTGYNLTYGGSSAYMGLSFPDSVCSSNAVSVVEDSFDTRTAIIASQELGRSLGSRQDMDGNFCLSTRLNIMTRKFAFQGPNIPNLWTFSRCSVSYFQDFLERLQSTTNTEQVQTITSTSKVLNGIMKPYVTLQNYSTGSNCLTQNSKESEVGTRLPYPDEAGDVYHADQQCKNANGKESFLCRDFTDGNYSTICQGMFCFSQHTSTCSFVIPLDGTICGNYKVCVNGMCIKSTSGANVRDDCPYGNQPILPLGDLCENRVYQAPYDCYSPSFNAACCTSCWNIKTNIIGCQYGDAIDYCNKSQCEDNVVRDQCCLTCTNGTSLIRISTKSPPKTGDVLRISTTSGTMTEHTNDVTNMHSSEIIIDGTFSTKTEYRSTMATITDIVNTEPHPSSDLGLSTTGSGSSTSSSKQQETTDVMHHVSSTQRKPTPPQDINSTTMTMTTARTVTDHSNTLSIASTLSTKIKNLSASTIDVVSAYPKQNSSVLTSALTSKTNIISPSPYSMSSFITYPGHSSRVSTKSFVSLSTQKFTSSSPSLSSVVPLPSSKPSPTKGMTSPVTPLIGSKTSYQPSPFTTYILSSTISPNTHLTSNKPATLILSSPATPSLTSEFTDTKPATFLSIIPKSSSLSSRVTKSTKQNCPGCTEIKTTNRPYKLSSTLSPNLSTLYTMIATRTSLPKHTAGRTLFTQSYTDKGSSGRTLAPYTTTGGSDDDSTEGDESREYDDRSDETEWMNHTRITKGQQNEVKAGLIKIQKNLEHRQQEKESPITYTRHSSFSLHSYPKKSYSESGHQTTDDLERGSEEEGR